MCVHVCVYLYLSLFVPNFRTSSLFTMMWSMVASNSEQISCCSFWFPEPPLVASYYILRMVWIPNKFYVRMVPEFIGSDLKPLEQTRINHLPS